MLRKKKKCKGAQVEKKLKVRKDEQGHKNNKMVEKRKYGAVPGGNKVPESPESLRPTSTNTINLKTTSVRGKKKDRKRKKKKKEKKKG